MGDEELYTRIENTSRVIYCVRDCRCRNIYWKRRFAFSVQQARELGYVFHLVEVMDHIQEFLDTVGGQSGVR
jgi:hypothetical protein